MYSDIMYHADLFSKSAPLAMAFGFPRLWIFLLMNAVSQYICATSVFTLTSECSSLAVTLVLTLRKFLSLVISIYYFENPFTWKHWIGTSLVFFGTVIFMDFYAIFSEQKIVGRTNGYVPMKEVNRSETDSKRD